MENPFTGIVICLSLSLLLLGGCARQAISRKKNIVYSQEHNLTLNVFYPKKAKQPKEVLLFIHGGSWVHGKKSTYNFFGRGMAHKGVVTVVMDYRLSPNANYAGMAMDAATAVKWIKENISDYKGDPDKIYISGHSAGGQIAGLIATDNSYFDSLKIQNPIKGAVMIDAFGLNMFSYLNKSNYLHDVYLNVFTDKPANWKRASPFYNLHTGMPPFLMFVGGKTYPDIISSSNEFYSSLLKYQPDAKLFTVKGTRHVGMIFSFINPRKKAYGQILDFMQK